MGLVLDLPAELETELAADAARLGLPLAEYVRRLLIGGLGLSRALRTTSELQVTDVTIKKPLRVSNENTAWPYIRLPYSQVDEVRRLLDARSIHHWVEENIISLNGGPYFAIINLGREGDGAAVQAILDSAIWKRIPPLRDPALVDLNAAHDYYANMVDDHEAEREDR
jgi:hypothetical protein